MTEGKEPRRPMSFRSWAGIALVILVVGILALIVWGIRSVVSAVPTPSDLAEAFEPEPYEEIGPVVISSIRDMARLTTVEAVEYTIVEKGTDRGWLDWARGDSIQLFAVARIGAGVDLSEVTVRDARVDTEEGVVELVIPRAEIQYVAVDNEATQILDRETGIFTRGDPRLESDARQIADEVLRQSAIDAGLLERAEENAREVLTDFLLGLGYRDVVVEFEN
ncbi:MAG: DUF4230 domain-containing protein [Actinobacteria bacterium]|nr:DUF4230 domain-containing protein [Actinomycetota bacterium]